MATRASKQTTEPHGPQRRIAPRALVWAGLAGLAYLLVAGGFRFDFQQTDNAHHIYIAEALLQGQCYLTPQGLRDLHAQGTRKAEADMAKQIPRVGRPPTPKERERYIAEWFDSVTHLDWTIIDGRFYGYWAPLTPVVLMPLVAVFGTGLSDALVNAVFGAVNVGLLYWLLRRVARAGLAPLSEAACIALTLVFAFGSVNFYMSCAGTVWLAAQVVTLTAVLAACLAVVAVRNRRVDVLLSGVFFGAALLGRNITGLLLPFFVILIWARTSGCARRYREALVRWVLFGVPCVVALGLQGWYNYARFGDVFEEGQAALIRETGNERFVDDFNRYGQFSLHYLPRNAYHYLLSWDLPADGQRGRKFDPDGNSIFLVTPLLLFALLAWRQPSWFTLAVASGALAFLAALLLFRATGFYEFGNRYLLEALPLWLLLAAAGMRGRLTPLSYTLVVLAIAVNVWGTYRYCDALLEPIRPVVRGWWLAAAVGVALAIGALWWVRTRRGGEVAAQRSGRDRACET